jgi:hypothetical protein
MGCTPNGDLAGITYSCDDKTTGGLKRIIVARLSDVPSFTTTGGVMTISAEIPAGKVFELEFNNKDAYTNFTDEKTVEASGVTKATPTLVVEFPKMDVTKRAALEKLTQAGDSIVAFLETAGGVHMAAGTGFGLYGSLAHGQTGNGRSEKNVYQLTLTGEEDELSLYPDTASWGYVIANL